MKLFSSYFWIISRDFHALIFDEVLFDELIFDEVSVPQSNNLIFICRDTNDNY
jgi:hypothetical protein